MNKAYLCLGGNLGNCAEAFAKAIFLLGQKEIVTISKSDIYTSPAWGMENAPDFYNQVIQIETKLEAGKLMELLLGLEKELGRERTLAKGYESRTIDMDILFFNNEIIEEKFLHIPHPRLHLRRFVLQPLHEIAPNLVHPVLKKSVTQLLDECTDTGLVKKLTHAV